MKSVILIIDYQKDFTEPKYFYALRHKNLQQIESAKENILLLFEYSEVVPIIIIYSNYRKDQFGKGLSMCIPGTEGHELNLNSEKSTKLFAKNKHSAFSNIDLFDYLTKQNIDTVFVAGFLAEYCIVDTATDALNLGFEAIIITDCAGSANKNQELVNKKYEAFKTNNGILIDLDHFKGLFKDR